MNFRSKALVLGSVVLSACSFGSPGTTQLQVSISKNESAAGSVFFSGPGDDISNFSWIGPEFSTPTGLSNFSCLALSVIASDIPPDPKFTSACNPVSNGSAYNVGIMAGLVPYVSGTSTTISASVPNGSGRTIQILGVQSSSGSCPSLSSIGGGGYGSNLDNPYLIAGTTIDVQSDVALNLTAAMPSPVTPVFQCGSSSNSPPLVAIAYGEASATSFNTDTVYTSWPPSGGSNGWSTDVSSTPVNPGNTLGTAVSDIGNGSNSASNDYLFETSMNVTGSMRIDLLFDVTGMTLTNYSQIVVNVSAAALGNTAAGGAISLVNQPTTSGFTTANAPTLIAAIWDQQTTSYWTAGSPVAAATSPSAIPTINSSGSVTPSQAAVTISGVPGYSGHQFIIVSLKNTMARNATPMSTILLQYATMTLQ